MAKAGSNKARSVEQESRIAECYRGTRSASSGAAVTDSGDVVTRDYLIECKTTGGPAEKPISAPKFVKELAKVMEEAHERSKTGMLCLRYYLPDSYLANRSGWVELTVRTTHDDVQRNEDLEEYKVDLQIAENKIFDLEAEVTECRELSSVAQS